MSAQNSQLQNALKLPGRSSGPILAPHLFGVQNFSLTEWLARPEIQTKFPAGSDQRLAIEQDFTQIESLTAGGGHVWKYLRDYIRSSHLYRLRGDYRYVQRVFASVHRAFKGDLGGATMNARALGGIPNKHLRTVERTERERLRKAAQRNPMKQAKHATARLHTLRATRSTLSHKIANGEIKIAKMREKLDALRRKLAKTETEIKEFELRITGDVVRTLPAATTESGVHSTSTETSGVDLSD